MTLGEDGLGPNGSAVEVAAATAPAFAGGAIAAAATLSGTAPRDATLDRWTYVYGQPLPNTAANSGAVVGLCDAFARQGCVTTIAYAGDAASEPDIRTTYELADTVACVALPTPDSSLRYPAMTLGALLRTKPHVLITRMPQSALLSALLGRPTILELHQHLPTFKHWKHWRRLLRLIPRRRLAIATLTDALAEKMDPLLHSRAVAIHTIPSSASDLAFTGAVPAFDIGYVGSFISGKGIERVHALAVAMPDVRFVVYGDPAKDPAMADQLAALPNVHQAGFVPRARLAEALASFRIGLAPYDSAGFGDGKQQAFVSTDSMSSLKLVEYLSASRAVVSSAIPAIEAVVADGEQALLCDPDNLDAWTAAIRRLMADEALQHRLATAGRSLYEAQYSFAIRAERFITLAKALR